MVLVWLTACKPPIEITHSPAVTFVDLEETANQGVPLDLTLYVFDRDGDELTVTLSSDLSGELASSTALSGEDIVFPLLLEPGPAGEAVHTITAVVADGDHEPVVGTATVTLNLAPSVPCVVLDPLEPNVETGVTVTMPDECLSVDPEGKPVLYDSSFTTEGSEVFINTFPTTITAGLAKGQVWTLTVNGCEALSQFQIDPWGICSTTSQTVSIGNAPPSQPEVVLTPQDAANSGQDLRCTLDDEAEDSDGDPVSYLWFWSRDGELVDGLNDSVLPATETASGDSWTCSAVPFDGEDEGEAATSDATDITSGSLSLNGASTRIEGNDSDQYLGGVVLGMGLDDADGIDLLFGIPSEDDGAGMVAVFNKGPYQPLVADSNGPENLSQRTGTLNGYTGGGLGAALARMADSDGDGLDDLLVSASGSDTVDPLVFLVQGESLLSAERDVDMPYGEETRIFSGTGTGTFGAAVAGGLLLATDEGLGAVAITELRTGKGRVFVFSAEQIAAAVDTLSADDAETSFQALASGDGFGTALDAGNDLDGDGLSELLMGAPGSTAVLRIGTSSGADLTVAGVADIEAGAQVFSLNDVNGDGYGDYGLTSPLVDDVGAAWVFWGQANLADSAVELANLTIDGSQAGARFGDRAVSLGDIGVDGLDDLAVAAPDYTVGATDAAGSVFVFPGAQLAAGGSLLATDAELQIRGSSDDDRATVAGAAGDLDRDGIADIVVSSPGAEVDSDLAAGQLFIYWSGYDD